MKTSKCLKCNKILPEKGTIHGLHEDCFQQTFGEIGDFYDLARVEADNAFTIKKEEFWNTSFFHGKFKKYTARLGKHHYILKLEQEIAPELPNVEFLCNQIASLLKLNIPWYTLVEFEGLRCFVSRNFVTEYSGGITLNHIYHYVSSAEKYTCRELLKVIERECKRYDDVSSFIQICLFDALIGNHDRHGRNLGFLESAKGKKLAPAYDNTSTLGLEHGAILKASFNPKGKIYTKTSTEPTMKEYIKEFLALGHEEIIAHFYKKIDIKLIKQLIDESDCSPLMKKAMEKLIHNRYEELEDALRTRS